MKTDIPDGHFLKWKDRYERAEDWQSFRIYYE